MRVFILFENCSVNLFPVKRIYCTKDKIICFKNEVDIEEFDLHSIEEIIVEN